MRAPAALAFAALAALPAAAGSGVEGDAATSVEPSPPAPYAVPIDPAAGAAIHDRCAAATYVWLQVRPDAVAEDEARFAHDSFVIALLREQVEAGAEDEEAAALAVERDMGLAVQRYLASFKAPAYGGSAEGLLAGDLDACSEVLAAMAEAAANE